MRLTTKQRKGKEMKREEPNKITLYEKTMLDAEIERLHCDNEDDRQIVRERFQDYMEYVVGEIIHGGYEVVIEQEHSTPGRCWHSDNEETAQEAWEAVDGFWPWYHNN